jgi:Spy/CpxP family protein refolding chaperone
MKFYTRVPWMTAALAAALLAATATAADPKDKDAKDKEAPAKVDKDVEAWINVLTAKIADRHDSIRESARHALIALGKPALPALQKLADGNDGAAAEAAKHVIAHIENGPDGHPGPFGPHGFRGEMGPHHRGFHMGSPPPHPGAGGPPGAGPHPGGPPGHPGGFGSGGFGPGGFDPNMIFNLLSGGKDYIVVSEMLANPMVSARDPGAKEQVESFMQRHGITNGQLTREQFAQYMQERMTERRAAREAANPGGPQPGAAGGFGPRPGAPGGAAGPGGRPGLGGPGGPGAMIEHAIKDLNLTDAQKTKLQEVIKAQGEKTREVMQEMHKDFLHAIKGAIGEEEFKKLEKNLPKPPAPGDVPGLSDKPKPPKEE